MSLSWWLLAVGLLTAFYIAMRFGSQLIERWTGREDRPEGSSIVFHAGVFLGLALAISIPPIRLLPNADSLVFSAFSMLGILVGSLAFQALFGRKRA